MRKSGKLNFSCLIHISYHLISRSQEKSYIDQKIVGVEQSVVRMVQGVEDRKREEEAKEEVRRLAGEVREVREGLDKNGDRIGEIVVKIDELVSKRVCVFYINIE